jgi:hypothetical protein
MHFRAAIFAVLLSLPACGAAQCVQAGGVYEGFRVTRVSVESPLEFPVGWIERSLLGPAIDSLSSASSNLPLKQSDIFHEPNDVAAMEALRVRYSVLRPGERIKLVVILPKFTACDMAAHTVEVVYRVYSTEALYLASQLLESQPTVPDRTLTIGPAAQKTGKVLPIPFIGYNHSSRLFGGIKSSWTGQNAFLNSAQLNASGSATSYHALATLGNSQDFSQGLLSHLEWKAGFQSSDEPAGAVHLAKSVGTAQFFAATRAYGPLGTMFRFGASLEGGTLSAGMNVPGVLSDAPQRVLKSFFGGTWSYGRQIWNASYGFQLGKGTDQVSVDYTKHLVDFSHQVRFLPREHWPIQLDSHANAGWIAGSSALVPVVERFFGGNLPGNFVDNQLWRIPANPLLRSFPQNRLNTSSSGQPIGGTNFAAINLTAAFPVWTYPAMPAMIRNAKPVADGIHLGLQPAQRASLEDFRAHSDLFPAVLQRAIAVIPDLQDLRGKLSSLADQNLGDDLTSELTDLMTTYIDNALQDIETAKKVSHNGLAWSICRKLSGDDPDTFPLAHLHDDLLNVVAPGLDALGRTQDAQEMRTAAEKMNQDKVELAARLAPIETRAVTPQAAFAVFNDDLMSVGKLGQQLKKQSASFLGTEDPMGTAAFDASEWSKSLISGADLGPDPAPFDTLYVLGRLALGIGALVPPQIESAAQAAEKLAATIQPNHPAESASLMQTAASLRAALAAMSSKLKKIAIAPGERYAREQNNFFVHALDVAFREMNLAAVSPVAMFDAAHISPQLPGVPTMRYGIGPGIRFSIVSFQVTLGYSFNPNPQPTEKRGALFFSMDVIDLFR